VTLIRGKTLPIAAILVAATGVYVRTLRTSFLGEDYALSAYFAADGSVRLPVDPTPYPPEDPRSDFPFRPMVVWLRLADAWLFGADPFGHHLLSLLLHATNSVLVYLLATRLFRDGGGAASFAAGVLFAVHPLHPAAVAWVSGRALPLAAFFSLFCFWWFVVYRDRGDDRGPLLFPLLLFLCALASHEIAMTLPGVLLAWDLFFGARRIDPGRRAAVLARTHLPYFLVLAVFVWLRFRTTALMPGTEPAAGFAAGLRHLPDTLGRALLPINTFTVSPTSQNALLVAVFFVGLPFLIGSLVYQKVSPPRLFWFALVWLALALIPALPVLPLDGGLVDGRFLYLALVPLLLALLSLLLADAPPFRPAVTATRLRCRATLGGLVILLGLMTVKNRESYRQASDQAGRVTAAFHEALAQTPADADVFALAPPARWRGAPLLDVNLEEALAPPFAPATRRVRVLRRFDEESMRVPLSHGRPMLFLRWNPRSERVERISPLLQREWTQDRAWKLPAWTAEELRDWSVPGEVREAGLAQDGAYVLESPGEDPWLASPPMVVPAHAVERVELLMAVSEHPIAMSQGRLYWTTLRHPEFSEKCAMDFTVTADGIFHLYVVELAAHEHWSPGDHLTGIRIDPVSGPCRARLQSVRLVPSIEFREAAPTGEGKALEWLGEALAAWAPGGNAAAEPREGALSLRSDGPDPYVVSPLLDVPLERARRVEIEMRVAESTDTNGWLYFTTDRRSEFGEDRKLPFRVQPGDGRFHVYVVVLPPEAATAGQSLTRLRLDPIMGPGHVELRRIVLWYEP